MSAPEDGQRVRQVDIAEALGIDKSTVSLALRNHPGISDATKERVALAAERMGYRPDALNALLTNLRWQRDSHRQYATFAFLRTSPTALKEKCDLIERGAARRAKELGIIVSDIILSDYPDMSSVCRVLIARGVSAILVGPNGADIEWDAMDWSGFSVINAGLGFTAPAAHAVVTDHFSAVGLAWENLRSKGYRRIGFGIQAFLNNEIDHRRVAAAQHILEYSTEPENRIPLLVHDYYDAPPFQKWFFANRPEAVITSTPTPSQWLQKWGCRIPGEVEVAALEIHCDPDHPEKAAEGVSEQLDRIGHRALDRLMLMLRDGERGLPKSPETIVIPPVWNPGIPPDRMNRMPYSNQ